MSTRYLAIAILFLTFAGNGSAHAQNLPPLHTMGLAGFYLGMSKGDIRTLVQKSSWQQQFPEDSSVFVVVDPDSITCLGPNRSNSTTSNCVFFDHLLLTIKSESEGVMGLQWSANNFTANNVAELRQFATVVFDRVTAVLGKPQHSDLKPSKITKGVIKKLSSKFGLVGIGRWEWRDKPGGLGKVIRSASLVIFRSQEGELILALNMDAS